MNPVLTDVIGRLRYSVCWHTLGWVTPTTGRLCRC